MSRKARKKIGVMSVVLTLSLYLIIGSSMIIGKEAASGWCPHEIRTQLVESIKKESNLPIEGSTSENPSNPVHSVIRENHGQLPKHLYYYARLPQGMVGFGCSTIFFMIGDSEFQLSFIDAKPVKPQSAGLLNGYSNYFIGEQSISNIRHYSYVVYENIYEGITLWYKFDSTGLKYEFEAEPYADINQIKLGYSGIDEIEVSPTRVELTISELTLVDDTLEVWYTDTGEKIDCSFHNGPDGSNPSPIIQFALDPTYDPSRPIVIDPQILVYSTYLGGSATEYCTDLVVDDFDNIYVSGVTFSSDFPTTSNAYDTSLNDGDTDTFGDTDAFIAKLSADGSELVFSTFIGGSASDRGVSLGLDSSDNIWVTGYTYSADFPTVKAYNSTYGGNDQGDAFLIQLSATGTTILYSTYLGGSGLEKSTKLRLDDSDNVYIIGGTTSFDFPTMNAYDPTYGGGEGESNQYPFRKLSGDIFISKFSANGNLLYSTFFGGSNNDFALNMILDSSGNIFFTGNTWSADFPTTLNAYSRIYSGYGDTFITKLSANGSTLIYSTFIGGKLTDSASGITLDNVGNVHIAGDTISSDYPTTPNAYDRTYNGGPGRRIIGMEPWGGDSFLTKLSADGSNLLYSTFIGGKEDELSGDCVIDSSDNVYLAGETTSPNFNTSKNAYDKTLNGGGDGYVIKLSKDGSTLLHSTYIGGKAIEGFYGIALNTLGHLCVAGWSVSLDFPVTETAVQKNRSAGGVNNDAILCVLDIPEEIHTTSTFATTLSISSTSNGVAGIELVAVVTVFFGLCLHVRRRKK